MGIELSTPNVGQLGDVVQVLRDGQDDSPLQLHPGDLGWFWRFGAEATATAVRTWSRDGQLVAIGFLDGPEVLRLTVAAEVRHDERVAEQVVADLSDPRRGVLSTGETSVEAPNGSRVQALLSEVGWATGEAWTPLCRDLGTPVADVELRIEVIGPEQVSAFTAVHRSAWGSTRFTDEAWRTMAAGLPFVDARCLLGYDDQGVAVAGITVWSAGPGRPGLIEPLGVHAEHRRRGHARAICVGAAAELRKLGSSSALVCTRSANVAAVAAYRSAGFEQQPERLDRIRG